MRSKQTPESAKAFNPLDIGPSNPPYELSPSKLAGNTPSTSRFSNIFSTPNLRLSASESKDRKSRRSHSVTSIERPKLSSFVPMRLPSIDATDSEALPWSVSMHESLRLSQFPIPPRQPNTKLSKSSLRVNLGSNEAENQKASCQSERPRMASESLTEATPRFHEKVQIHVQEPTASPRVSTSVKENAPPGGVRDCKRAHVEDADKEEDPRSSVHLHNMRISHHLRSGSLLSWDALADAPDLPTPPPVFRERTVSDQSRFSGRAGRSRHDRQTSSSGFASSRVPSKWGRILSQGQQREEMSSVYSSRPHSPPDSFGDSVANLSLPVTHQDSATSTTVDLAGRQLHTPATDNEDTPKPIKRYGITNLQAVKRASVNDSLLNSPALARNNSVAITKRSKFHEEFSPSPPRKKSTPTLSIMRILRPRSIVRNRSDSNIKDLKPQGDGPSDMSDGPTDRERRVSQSFISLQKEHQALKHDKEASPTWERALKTQQEERSAFFLPQNKALAMQCSPFRERSSTLSARSKSIASVSPLHTQKNHDISPTGTQVPTPSGADPEPPFPSKLITRRSALIHMDDSDFNPDLEVQAAFDKQTDTAEIVGAWGRYPSHTRHDRASSAGHLDSVQSRDFALEAAIQFAKGEDIEDNVDPATRPESPPLVGGKKRKKRVDSTPMVKSHSMTFGKNFLKNYTKIFRSQSTEFQRHGRGHRSSIATGGTLEYPELEILPEVWRRRIVRDGDEDGSMEEGSGETHKVEPSTPAQGHMNREQRVGGSEATLRPNRPDDNDFALDGVIDGNTSTDRARVWSIYYEDCIPAFPRASTDLNSISHPNLNELLELAEFGARPARCSLDSKRANMHSMTMPARLKHHSRHGSRMSRMTIASRGSVVPSFLSMSRSEGQGIDDGADANSIDSVRKSTLDLVNMYREQEVTERERVLNLMRMESVYSRVDGL